MHSNSRGDIVARTLAAHDLTSSATWFQKKHYSMHQPNYSSEENQIDHLFVSYHGPKTVTDCWRGKPLTSSDHLPLYTSLRVAS
eukprot:7043205-Ditylum_brightwellii.AAC.1